MGNPHAVVFVDDLDALDFERLGPAVEADVASFPARVNAEFMKLGARGVTLVFSSGDGGVGGTAPPGSNISECTKFQPTFPPASPYVLSVGGTTDGPPTPASYEVGWTAWCCAVKATMWSRRG